MKSLTKTLTSVCLLFTLLGTAVPANAATYSSISEQLVSLSEVIANLQSQMMGRVLGVSTNDAVASYNFDAGSGSTLADTSGSGNDGSINGATWTTGITNGGLEFDGNSDYVDLGTWSVSGNALTLSAWVNADDWAGDMRIISKAVGTAEQDHFFMLSERNDSLRVRIKTGGTTVTLVGNQTLPTNEWVHVAATYDGSTITLYQDGVAVGSRSYSGNLDTSTAPVHLGQNPDGSSRFDGTMDDVRVYDRSLSAAEMQDIVATATGGGSTDPDPTPTDTDDDGVADTADNCPNTANANQADADNDGTGDACDSTPNGDTSSDPTPSGDGVYRSGADLGWSAGQEISNELANFIENTAVAGDTLILEHSYEYSALTNTVTFPTDFMLAAVEGVSLTIRDTATSDNGSYPARIGPIFSLSDRNTINNVVFNMPETPDTGYSGNNPTRHIDYSNVRLFEAYADDITLFQSELRGQIEFQLSAGDANNLTFYRTVVDGGFWAVLLGSGTNDFRAHQSVFRNTKGDGIKTVNHSCPNGLLRPVVTQSIFENNNRDGIDTTGGFAEGLIRDTIFRGGSSLDFKNHFENGNGYCEDRLNRDILIEDSFFFDAGNAIVLTTLDDTNPPVVNDTNAAQWIVKNVNVRNTVFQGDSGRAFLIKDARDIYWDNIELLGNVSEKRVLNPDGTDLNVSAGNTNYNLVGTNVTTGPARSFSEQTDYSFPFGQSALTLDVPLPGEESTPDATSPDPTPSGDGVYRSGQDLGWTAGQDVTTEFADFIANVAQPGDTLHLEHMYDVTGQYVLFPDDFTLSAETGAGLDILDTADHSSPLIRLANRNVIDNVTINHSNSPDTGTASNNPTPDVDYHRGRSIDVVGNDVVLKRSRIAGFVGILLNVTGDRFTIQNSHIRNAKYSVRLIGTDGFRVNETVFSDALIDGIKTIDSEEGTTQPAVTNSVFERGRDGIDTTGGWYNGLIKNVIFRDNSVAAIDIKNGSLYDGTLSSYNFNTNITIEDSRIINSPNGVVLTFVDTGNVMTPELMEYWVPNNIYLNNNVYEQTADKIYGTFVLVKDGHNVYLDNTDIYNGNHDYLIRNIVGGTIGWSSHDIVSTNVTKNDARLSSVPTDYPFAFGPGVSVSPVPSTDTTSDSDSDNVADDVDNCPTTANANQTDTDGDGIGDACDATPNGDVTAPTISAVTTSNIGETNATISWSTDELATSEVLYGTDSSYGDTTNETNTVTRSHTETLTGLNADTTYHFQVKSRDAAGNSAASQDLTFTTLSAPDTTSPTVTLTEPGNGATVSDVITISADATDPSASGQSVTGVASVAFSVDGTTLATDTSAPYDTGLDTTTLGDGTYTITAVATDGAGNTNTDTVSVIVDNAVEPPADTTDPTITYVGEESTNNDPITHVITYTTNEPTTATLHFGTNRNNLNTDVESATLTTTHTFTLEGLSNKQTYHFALTATDAAGNSATSDTDSFRTIGKPQKVQNLTARSGSVILEWELPGNVEAIDEVVVIRRNGGAQGRTSDEPLVTLEPAATTYTDESANMERQYTYTVYTISDNEYSDPVSVTFKKEPGAPELTPEAAAEAEAEESRRSSGGGGGSSRNRSDSNSTRVPASVPATTVAAPNSIITTDNLNVRVTPGGTLIRMVPQGTSGTKLSDAPVQQGGYTWIRVNFAGGTAGWVAQEFIRTNSSSTLTPERRAALLQQIRMLLMQIVQLQTALNAMR